MTDHRKLIRKLFFTALNIRIVRMPNSAVSSVIGSTATLLKTLLPAGPFVQME